FDPCLQRRDALGGRSCRRIREQFETHLQGRHWYGHRLVIRARRILGFGVFGGYEAGGEGRPPEQNGHPGGTRDPPWCGAQQRVAEPTRPFEVSGFHEEANGRDRKSTRLNSSHVSSSYAVFWLKNKK